MTNVIPKVDMGKAFAPIVHQLWLIVICMLVAGSLSLFFPKSLRGFASPLLALCGLLIWAKFLMLK